MPRPPFQTLELAALLVALSTGTAAAFYLCMERLPLDGWHSSMIRGLAPAPNQYRILTPLLAEGIHRLRDGIGGAGYRLDYALVIGLANLGTLLLLLLFCRRWFADGRALLAPVTLSSLLAISYSTSGIQPTDAVNLTLVTAGLLALQRSRHAHLLWLVPLATLNRESALVIAAYVLAVRWPDGRRRALGAFLLLAAEWALVYGALRLGFGHRSYYCQVLMWGHNVSSASAWLSVSLFLGPCAAAGLTHIGEKPAFLRRACWVAPPYVLLHFVVALVDEVRLFLPLMPVLIPLALASLPGDLPAPPRPAGSRADARQEGVLGL